MLSSVLLSSDGACILTTLVAFIVMCAEEWICAMDNDGVYSLGKILWLLVAYAVGDILRLVYVRGALPVKIGAVSPSDPSSIAPVESEL